MWRPLVDVMWEGEVGEEAKRVFLFRGISLKTKIKSRDANKLIHPPPQ